MRALYSVPVRLLLLWSLLISAALAGDQGLLWHISGKGVDGYLFGTMHSDDPRVTRLPAEVERHFAAATTLVLEVSLDEQSEMAAAVQMLLPASSSLTALVGEEMSRQVKQAMLARGVPAEATERLQLWATALTLSLPKPQSGLFLDKLLYQQALASNKKFTALESINEQIAIFTALSVDEQKELLRNVLDEYPGYPLLLEQMTEAYLARDLEQLLRISEDNPMSSNPALQEKVMMRLVEQRNRRMAARIEPLLSQGGVFVAIGALHLSGKEGVVALLRQRGYQVEAVY
jgi:uncharacterized protein YbaP (TraB family)